MEDRDLNKDPLTTDDLNEVHTCEYECVKPCECETEATLVTETSLKAQLDAMRAEFGNLIAISGQRVDVLEQMLTGLNKTNFTTSCANVAVINLLKDKGTFTSDEIDTKFEEVLDQAMGLKAKKAGEAIELYDNLICEIWINDITNPDNKSVDYRGYLNKILYLTDADTFEEFHELTSLHGEIFEPGKIYKVIRKMPDNYPLNPSIASKEIVYDVLIHAIKTGIKQNGATKDINSNTNV